MIANTRRMYGHITRINRDRGYGFLRDELGESRFFHTAGVLNTEIQEMHPGQSVIFEPSMAERGPIARNVLALDC